MRVLSALVLTHCIGCVVPEDSDDEFTMKKSKLRRIKYKVNSTNVLDVNCTESISTRMKYPQDSSDLTRIENFSDRPSISEGPYVKNVKNNTIEDDESLQKNIDWLSEPRQTSDTKLTRPRRRIHRSHRNWQGFHKGYRKSNEKDDPKHYEKDTYDRDTRIKKIENNEPKVQHPVRRYQHKTKKVKTIKEDEGFQEDPEGWDDWSNWTECSVTCGRGRQVRWRHCKIENCQGGLKIAQMKTCRLRDCSKKGFLKWLGIKT